MDDRERFLQTLLFGRPDRVPLRPGWPRESTLAAWHSQGLPEGADFRQALAEALGLQSEPASPDLSLDVSFRMIPTFEERVLEHRDGHYIVQDWMGAITEISDRYDYTYIRTAKDFVTRKWHRFPVESRRDWLERIEWRYDPHAPGRFPADFEERCRSLRGRKHVLGVSFSGPFWQLREWCGFEGLCLFMAEDPGFVDEMAGFWGEFVHQVLAQVLERVELDHVVINEDMAYKAHAMISPAMARRFLLPAYRRWVELIRAHCQRVVIEVDSDGYVADLIPIWLEAGINCCSPMEVAAGNDLVAYRRLYGRRLAYQGGIDKRAIAAGGSAMRQEVLRVVPPLLEEGGFVPSCDHGVPPDISWPAFVEYSRLLAGLTGWL
ncbi:MAG: uroporphyrinogen decarboxylase family protein [Anaerolineae bacterium]|nr:uroporphyrinogen decarboxylase family protein [Anaerolineae bacterium]